jgi:hypothetical protein
MAKNFSTPGDPGAGTRDPQDAPSLGLSAKTKMTPRMVVNEMIPDTVEQSRKCVFGMENASGPFKWKISKPI